MNTTELIQILKEDELGGISKQPREISLYIKGIGYFPKPSITVSGTGDGIVGPEIDLDVEGEFWPDESQEETELELKWTKCSEEMPEEREWIGTKLFGTTISDEVYVTFEMPNGERFTDHLSFQNGKLPPHKQSEIDAFHKGAKPIAWQPLPKPYEPQEKRCADCKHYGKLNLDCGRCDDDRSMFEPQESEVRNDNK